MPYKLHLLSAQPIVKEDIAVKLNNSMVVARTYKLAQLGDLYESEQRPETTRKDL